MADHILQHINLLRTSKFSMDENEAEALQIVMDFAASRAGHFVAKKLELEPKDLIIEEIELIKGSPGIRVTYLPTRQTACCTVNRSQHQNKAWALEELTKKVQKEMEVGIQENMVDAFRFHMVCKAWELHQLTNTYNAWDNNFKVRLNFSTFLKERLRYGSECNVSVRTWFAIKDKIAAKDVIPFVVVTGCSTSRMDVDGDLSRWEEFKARKTRLGMLAGSLVLCQGLIPAIMQDVLNKEKSPLEVAEDLTLSNYWESLWSKREESSFMFDIVWNRIHRYRPLFEGKYL